MNRRIVTILTLTIAVAACGRAADDPRAVAPDSFVPPVTKAPDPVPGQDHAVPLTAYVGHGTRDAVAGVSFFDRTEVANAVIDAVPDARLRRRIVADTTQAPIFAKGDRIGAHGCEPDACDDRNWTVFVAVDGNADRAAVCHHDRASMGDTSRWTTRAGTSRRPGTCPSV